MLIKCALTGANPQQYILFNIVFINYLWCDQINIVEMRCTIRTYIWTHGVNLNRIQTEKWIMFIYCFISLSPVWDSKRTLEGSTALVPERIIVFEYYNHYGSHCHVNIAINYLLTVVIQIFVYKWAQLISSIMPNRNCYVKCKIQFLKNLTMKTWLEPVW